MLREGSLICIFQMKDRMKTFVLLSTLLCVSCSPESQFTRVDLDFSDYSRMHGPAEAFVKFFAEDGIVLRSGLNPIMGKDSLRSLFANFQKGWTLTWEPVEVDCSENGDLGYTIGKHQTRITDSIGSAKIVEGRYVTFWKRQSDHSLKAIADMGSPSPTPGDTNVFTIIRTILRTEESKDGDFGCSFGSVELRPRQTSVNFVPQFGKYVYAWKRNPDGSKRTLIDLSNPSPSKP